MTSGWRATFQVINKSNQTQGLGRTLAPCDRDVKTKAYESRVRLRLEYAAQVWNLHSTTIIVDRLKQVQRAAVIFLFAVRLGLPPHPLPNCTKIHHQLIDISLPPSFQLATYLTKQEHLYKYIFPVATIENYKQILFLSTLYPDLEPTSPPLLW